MLLLAGLVVLNTSFSAQEAKANPVVKHEKELLDCKIIKTNHERELCFVGIMEEFEIENISAYAKEIELKDGFNGSCHMVLHELGDHYSQKYDKETLLIDLKLDMYLCQGGFLHGIQEGYAKHEGSKGILGSSLIICAFEEIPRQASCLHGVGHGHSLTEELPIDIMHECIKLTDALITKYPTFGYESERTNFNVKCSEGYFMKRYNDHREKFKDLTLTKVKETCESDKLVANTICITAFFRPYISMLMDPTLNPDFEDKAKSESIYQKRILEMDQYCETLEGDFKKNCFFTKGTLVFDRFNYNSDHTPLTATKVYKNCKGNEFCYNGYFFTLLTPSAVKYPTKEYLAEFCREAVCNTERDYGLAFVTFDKDTTRR